VRLSSDLQHHLVAHLFNNASGGMPMTTSTKSQSASPTIQVRDTLETSAEQFKEARETFSTATNEAAQAVQESCSTALKGMQDYNRKIVEFTQANIKSHVEFLQKLGGVKSPTEFLELSTSHTRHQMETLAEQSKHLAVLAQKVTADAAEPLKTGFAKAPIAPR